MVDDRKRQVLRAMGAAGMFGLTGCVSGFTGGGSDNSQNSGGNNTSGSGGGGSSDAVQWWNLYVSGSQRDATNEIASRFEEQTGIPVNQTKYENTPYKSALTNALGTNNAPDIFYIWAGPNRLGRYVQNNTVISLADYISNKDLQNQVTGAVEGVRYKPGEILSWQSEDGEPFGYPSEVTPIPIYYNKQVLSDAGIDPQKLKHATDIRWDDFLEMCQSVADADFQPIITGNRNRWPLGHMVSAFMIKAAGVDVFLDAAFGLNNRSLTDEPFVEALSRVKMLYEENYLNESINSINDNEAAAQIFNNQAAFYHSPSISELLDTQAPDSFGGIPDQMDYMWWPYFPKLYENGVNERVSVVPGNARAVSSQAKKRGKQNLDNTTKFLEFLNTKEIQQYWIQETGNLVSDTTVYEGLDLNPTLNALTKTIDQIQNADAVGSVFDVVFLPDTSEALLSGGQELLTEGSPKDILQNAQNVNQKALSNLE